MGAGRLRGNLPRGIGCTSSEVAGIPREGFPRYLSERDEGVARWGEKGESSRVTRRVGAYTGYKYG